MQWHRESDPPGMHGDSTALQSGELMERTCPARSLQSFQNPLSNRMNDNC